MSKSLLEKEIQSFLNDNKTRINESPRTRENRDREALKNIAVKIYISPIKGGITEGLLTTKNILTNCFNENCSNQNEVINKTNDAMKFIEEWLSMLVAQNIIRKINGDDFLINSLESSSDRAQECSYNKRKRNKSPRKAHEGTRY